MSRIRIFSILLVVILLVSFAGGAAAAPAESHTCTRFHHVQRGDTLARLARTYGTSIAALQQINGLGYSTRIYAGTFLCVSTQSQANVYIVQRGDTLTRIARRFGVDVHVLARVNNIHDINRIYAGMRLIIPDFTIQ
jgi:LysM repeat protein